MVDKERLKLNWVESADYADGRRLTDNLSAKAYGELLDTSVKPDQQNRCWKSRGCEGRTKPGKWG